MKEIAIIGVGLTAGSITLEALDAIKKADVPFGAPRLITAYQDSAKRAYSLYRPEDVAGIVASDDAENFAVLVSGDVGFYSAAKGLCAVLSPYTVRLVPGISTVNAFFAKLQLPWQDAAFISAHGRDTDIVSTVRRNRLTFCLAGSNAGKLGGDLCNVGFSEIKVFIGENLGTPQARVLETRAEELADMGLSELTVLLFVNESFDSTVPVGLPDSMFLREKGIPMTKSEIRAVSMSKLCIRPGSLCYDIGAGTGSVSVEMALSAYKGSVYAVERREDAISLISQNSREFHVSNIIPVQGEAPGAMKELPAPDVVFIGGSGGELDEIIDAVLTKNPKARIVITAVTLETVSAALAALSAAGLDADIVQISAARGRKVGRLHMMEAQNPVTIISAGGSQL